MATEHLASCAYKWALSTPSCCIIMRFDDRLEEMFFQRLKYSCLKKNHPLTFRFYYKKWILKLVLNIYLGTEIPHCRGFDQIVIGLAKKTERL